MQFILNNTVRLRYGAMVLFILMALMGYMECASGQMLFALLCIALLVGTDTLDWKIRKKYSLKNAMQIMGIYAFFSIFLLCAFFSSRTIKTHIEWIIIDIFGIIRGLIFWGVQVASGLPPKSKYISWGEKIRKYKYLGWYLGIVVVFVILSLDTFKVIPMWDSREYYRAAQRVIEWDFTPSFFSYSNLCGHKSLGYAILLAIGGWICNDSLIGIHLIQLIASIGSILAMICIVNILFSKSGKVTPILGVTVFTFSPMLLGMLPNINVDFAMLLFFVYFLYSYTSNMEVLEWFLALMLCFTKEPSIFLYGGFVLGIYLKQYIQSPYKGKYKFKYCFTLKQYFKYVSPLVLWLICFAACNRMSTDNWGKVGGLQWNGIISNLSEAFNSFGISVPYIWNRIQHIWCFNFMWVVTVLILVLLIKRLYDERQNIFSLVISGSDNIVLIPLLVSLAFFSLITLIYITHNHYRYVAPCVIIIILLLEILMNSILNNRWILNGSLVGISILFLVQSFVSIDPITQKGGKGVDIGNDVLTYYAVDFDKNSVISDYINYNREASQWSVLLEKIMRDIEPNEDTLILFPKLSGVSSVYQVLGFWEDVNDAGLFWNKEEQTLRTMNLNNMSEMKKIAYGIIDEDGNIVWASKERDKLSDYTQIYYIIIPSEMENVHINKVQGNSYMVERLNYVKYGGWKVKIEKWKIIENSDNRTS